MQTLAVAEVPPLFDINTTPLIDVLLVLLIMFVITIPLQTHAVKVDLPSGRETLAIDAVRNRIVITDRDVILWNGTPLTADGLAGQLAAVGAMPRQPEVHLQPHATARYALVDEVLAMSKRAHVTRLGFVGNERYSAF